MNIDTELFVTETDAASRIAITVPLLANSPRIAQLGNLSHNPAGDGFISGDGRITVSADARCVCSWEQQMVAQPIQSDFFNPVCDYGFASQTASPQNLPSVNQNALYQFTAKLYTVNPTMLPKLLMDLTGQNDLVYLSQSLGLDQKDFDKVCNGWFIRSFADNLIGSMWGEYLLPIYDHLGHFVRMNVLFQGAIFERKCFKYIDSPGEIPFLFKPEHPGIWFRPATENRNSLVLDTDAEAVINRISIANAWLNDAGNIAELDWKILRGHEVYYLWYPEKTDSRKQIDAALRFVAEARKHGISVKVSKPHKQNAMPDIIEMPDLIKLAYHYDLDVPACLKEHGYMLSAASLEPFIPTGIPFFWDQGGCTWFYGPGQKEILQTLIQSFCGKYRNAFPRKKVDILFPSDFETRVAHLLQKIGLRIPCILSSILQVDDALEKMLQHEGVEVLFIMNAEAWKANELTSVLDLCERLHIVTGVFSSSQDKPEDMVLELVSQRYMAVKAEDGLSILMKNMGTREKKRFFFDEKNQGTISFEKASEQEMATARQL